MMKLDLRYFMAKSALISTFFQKPPESRKDTQKGDRPRADGKMSDKRVSSQNPEIKGVSEENNDRIQKNSADSQNCLTDPPHPASGSDKKPSRKKEVLSLLAELAFLILVIWVLFFGIFKVFSMPDDTMDPSIKARDVQVVYTLQRSWKTGDVIVWKEGSTTLSSRVAAMPGDVVDLEDGYLRVNGQRTDYSLTTMQSDPDKLTPLFPLTLMDGQYFVAADNEQMAEAWLVDESQIQGKVILLLRRSQI